jgi:hypothetical protein
MLRYLHVQAGPVMHHFTSRSRCPNVIPTHTSFHAVPAQALVAHTSQFHKKVARTRDSQSRVDGSELVSSELRKYPVTTD